ncbi:Uma2 family endonuclease [uncultured Thiocystis sp.]|jgi:Uma2 family endonuclease|uniref:Uma2 family endonuclease n=1 Tax=uncultured Thiocystis sp. TaxID=1202134 RepID=UPI0025F58BDA|nr:Uma2 family endonuclease [uncultured Thiocystis sp.]
MSMAQPLFSDPDWPAGDPPEGMPPVPPTQDELPCDDGEPMETQRHKWQMDLLIDALDLWLQEKGEGYTNGNMFVYFSLEQTRGRHFRGPDVFVVLGVPRGERKSWVVWEQGKAPDVVIELLSRSTAASDKGEKKQIYQDRMRVPEYFWFDPFNPEDRAGFQLTDGVYQPIERDGQGRLRSPLLGLALILWQGDYLGIEGTWLRWATPDGVPLPTHAEAAWNAAEDERQRAETQTRLAEEQTRLAEEQTRLAEEQRRFAQAQQVLARTERARAERAEAELTRLKALLEGDPPR